MNGAERAAIARVTGAAVGQINSTVADVGFAVRGKVRRRLRPLSPVATRTLDIVDLHHDIVHTTVGVSAQLLGECSAQALRRTGTDAGSIADSPKARPVLAGLNAAFGDQLPVELAGEMRLSVAPDVAIHPSIAVFVHGLGGHDQQWGQDYAEALAALGLTSVVAHYPTGRSIADNAAAFDRTMIELVGSWPVAVERVVLVGHSMGGLVAATALAAAPQEDGANSPEGQSPSHGWREHVSDLVTLGSPFSGAPLERFARSALRLGQLSDVARPIIALGDQRSVGIKDLGDGVRLSMPERVRHHAVVASLGSHPQHPASLLLGDGIIPQRSARGHGALTGTRTIIEVNETGHLHLLDHPNVTDLLRVVGAQDTTLTG